MRVSRSTRVMRNAHEKVPDTAIYTAFLSRKILRPPKNRPLVHSLPCCGLGIPQSSDRYLIAQRLALVESGKTINQRTVKQTVLCVYRRPPVKTPCFSRRGMRDGHRNMHRGVMLGPPDGRLPPPPVGPGRTLVPVVPSVHLRKGERSRDSLPPLKPTHRR